MEKLSLEDQINIIDQIIKERPEIRKPLELHKMTLQAQLQLRKSPKKGTFVDYNKSIINDLQQKAHASNKPIASLLEPSIFISDALIQACEKVVTVLREYVNENWLNEFLNEVKGKDISDAVGAALHGDAEYFKRLGERFGTEPAILLFIIGTLIQPCLEEIANNVDSSFLERWWQASCPVCGRTTRVAKLKSRKRYLTCTFCGAEYLADIFLCANCGNGDPATLKFLMPEGYPEFRVDYCEKCRHYLKVIDEDKLRKRIPKGLEDIMTIDLDLMAKDAGLVRA